MAVCKHCGTKIDKGIDRCLFCGTPVKGYQQTDTYNTSDTYSRKEDSLDGNNNNIHNTDTKDSSTNNTTTNNSTTTNNTTNNSAKSSNSNINDFFNSINIQDEDVKNNIGYALISYFSFLVFVTIIMAPQSKFARFHANQGLVLLITQFILQFVSSIFSSILPMFSGIFGLTEVLIMVLMVIGIINVIKGEMKKLPIIGEFQILK